MSIAFFDNQQDRHGSHFSSAVAIGGRKSTKPSATGIIPRFNFNQAQMLLQKGRSPFEVIAAAKRLGDHDLEQQIVKHVFKGYANPVSFVQGREVGLPRRRPSEWSVTSDTPTRAV